MNKDKPIYVTQPSLAPLDEYVHFLEGIWDRGILTHNGPLVQELEKSVSDKLGLDHFIAVSNGTIGLRMAIKALKLKGEIITTPFTWIATISAIKWEGCTPVFCDINPETFNIDENKIEDLITKDTVAIMPVHVFGNPCNVEKIDTLAKKHGLKVIYDAAHAIGSTYHGKSLLAYGDVSATSLHATKLLNTAEGGGCVASEKEIEEKLRRIRFFGHGEDRNIEEDGFNGKMTEIHAGLGLANLKYYGGILEDRKRKYLEYYDSLKEEVQLSFQKIQSGGELNYSYFPLVFESETLLLKVEANLKSHNIFPRRYFYPSVNTFSHVVNYSEMKISEDISKRILCLPLYLTLSLKEIKEIANIVKKTCRGL